MNDYGLYWNHEKNETDNVHFRLDTPFYESGKRLFVDTEGEVL